MSPHGNGDTGTALPCLPAVSQPGVIPTASFHWERWDCVTNACPQPWIMPSTVSPAHQALANPQPGPTAPAQPSSPQNARWDQTQDVGFAGGSFPWKPLSRSRLPEVPEQAGQGWAASQGGDSGLIPMQEWLPAGKTWPRRIRPRWTHWGAGIQSSGTAPVQMTLHQCLPVQHWGGDTWQGQGHMAPAETSDVPGWICFIGSGRKEPARRYLSGVSTIGKN